MRIKRGCVDADVWPNSVPRSFTNRTLIPWSRTAARCGVPSKLSL